MTLKRGKSCGNWGKFKRSFVFRLPIFRKRRSPVTIDSGEKSLFDNLKDGIYRKRIVSMSTLETQQAEGKNVQDVTESVDFSGEYYGNSPFREELLLQREKNKRNAEKAERYYEEMMMPSPAIWDNEQLPSSSGRAIRELQRIKRAEIKYPETKDDSYRIWIGGDIGFAQWDARWVYYLQQFTDTLTMPVWKFVWRRLLNG